MYNFTSPVPTTFHDISRGMLIMHHDPNPEDSGFYIGIADTLKDGRWEDEDGQCVADISCDNYNIRRNTPDSKVRITKTSAKTCEGDLFTQGQFDSNWYRDGSTAFITDEQMYLEEWEEVDVVSKDS